MQGIEPGNIAMATAPRSIKSNLTSLEDGLQHQYQLVQRLDTIARRLGCDGLPPAEPTPDNPKDPSMINATEIMRGFCHKTANDFESLVCQLDSIIGD